MFFCNMGIRIFGAEYSTEEGSESSGCSDRMFKLGSGEVRAFRFVLQNRGCSRGEVCSFGLIEVKLHTSNDLALALK